MPRKVGDYRIEDEMIGQGQYGQVFKGVNLRTNQAVAVKIISNRRIDQRISNYLRGEISIMKSLSHDNIVRLFDVLKTANNTYIFAEYCSGGDLEVFLRKVKTVPEPLLKAWAIQLVDAFSLLKANCIIHRDVKLANILLSDNTPNAQIKLADFGFSKLLSENSMAGTVLGTPMFMAPELLRNEKYSYKADVWSIGVLLYQLLVGTSPFKCNSLAELKRLQMREVQFPDNRGMSSEAKDFIRKMLTHSVHKRWDITDLAHHAFLVDCPLSLQHPIADAGNLEVIDETDASQEESTMFNNDIRHEKILQECLGIEQMYSVIEDYLKIYEEMTANGDDFTALGIANCTKVKANQLIAHNEAVRTEHNIIESTDDKFSELYNKTQQIFMRCLEIFEEMKEKYGADYGDIVQNETITEIFVDDIVDLMKNEVAPGSDLSLEVLHRNILILTAILELKSDELWAQDKINENTEEFQRKQREE